MSDSTELTLPERAALALGTPKYEQEIRDLVAKTVTITEVKNKDGRDQCHGAMMTLKTTRVAIEKAAKSAREDATAFSKAVIAEEKRLVALAEPEEARLQVLRDAWDAEREAERQAKAAAEKARVDGIRARIERFMLDAVTAANGSASNIDAFATKLSETMISLEEFNEFAGEAQVKRDDTVKWLRERQQDAANREAEARRLAEERAALAKERAEAFERERLAEAARAEREAKEREARRIADEEQRLIQERAAAAMRQQQAEHEARMREQQAAADKLNAATSEIQGIQQQVIIATQGRLGVRKGGTIECIRQTLAETERWDVEPGRFGILAGAAESAKTTAVAEIRRLLAEAEAKEAAEAEAARIAQAEADRIFAEEEQRRQQAAEEAARVEAARLADLAEKARREQVQFEQNGPGEAAIIGLLAEHFDVEERFALGWVLRFDVLNLTGKAA